jgi:HPt (histidine-containing phosphotransfer) domain-containing protein
LPRWRKRLAFGTHALRRVATPSFRHWSATDLPTLLALLGRRHVPLARATRTVLELDVDPALAPDLDTAFPVLGEILAALLERAIDVACGGTVALHVDLVGDTPTSQTLHFTVADDGPAANPNTTNFLRMAAQLEAIGGLLHVEPDQDHGTRVIVEIVFDMPRRSPRVDIDALRRALGGQAALREVVTALDGAITRDLDELDGLLAAPGTDALRAWLHRVSGVLGMAEATDLANTGLLLESDLGAGRVATVDVAIRAFGEDVARVLALLREHRGSDGL